MDWRCAVAAWVALAVGCAAPGGDQAGIKIAAEGDRPAAISAEVDLQAALAAVELRIDELQQRLDVTLGARIGDLETRVEARMGDVITRLSAMTTIGGGGDSVTSWMYAAIAGAAVLYPCVIRPARRAIERRRRQRKRKANRERRRAAQENIQ